MDKSAWEKIVEHACMYPSPHNSQPIKIKFVSTDTAELYYDLDLGLPAENYGIPFAHVCAGVFLESLETVANGLGYRVVERLETRDMDFSSNERLHRFATVSIITDKLLDKAITAKRFDAFKNRQTSRRPYDRRVVPKEIIESVQAVALSSGYTFKNTTDQGLIDKIITINQATLFDDLRNNDVYKEIMLWLRFSRKEAVKKRDGLSAETMLIPGGILRFGMQHRGLWETPIVGDFIKWVYLRTMRGVSQLGWLEGPFASPRQYIEAGRCFMKIWLLLTEYGVYLHPFGTVITNPRSHKKFVRAAHINESSESMAWMLFRFGYSKKPPQAWRRSPDSMIVRGEE